MRTSDFTSIAVANTELVNQHVKKYLAEVPLFDGFVKNVVLKTFSLKVTASVVILYLPE